MRLLIALSVVDIAENPTQLGARFGRDLASSIYAPDVSETFRGSNLSGARSTYYVRSPPHRYHRLRLMLLQRDFGSSVVW